MVAKDVPAAKLAILKHHGLGTCYIIDVNTLSLIFAMLKNHGLGTCYLIDSNTFSLSNPLRCITQ